MTPAQAELVARYRRLITELESQIADLESGAIKFYRGPTDASADAIALATRQRDALLETIASAS